MKPLFGRACGALAFGVLLLVLTAAGFPSNPVDEAVSAALAARGAVFAERCTDEVFVRRVYLDVLGTLPRPRETEAFLKSTDPDKRAGLVEQLFLREEYADWWSLRWGDVLRVKSEFPINLWPNAVQAYHRWIREALRGNLPYDGFARALLTSSGSNFRDPPVNFYRAVAARDPASLAGAAALTFMGTRLETWPAPARADMAAFFSRVAFKKTLEWKEEIVYSDPLAAGDLAARFPDGRTVVIPETVDPRTVFADWLTGPDNPWFARALVNRVWYWLLGTGITEPADAIARGPDGRPASAGAGEEILRTLTDEFRSSGYDFRSLLRLVLTSRTYQQTSAAVPGGTPAELAFARYTIRRLDAEILADALAWLGGVGPGYSSPVPEPFTFVPDSNRTIALADSVPPDSALADFAAPYHEAARAALAERLGTAARDLGSPRGRFAAGPVWDLIHAAQLEATGADVSLAALPDPDAVIPAGPVTRRDLLRIYPYENTLAVVELTGDELRRALERSARAYAPYTFADSRSLLEPGAAGHNLDGAHGVTYEVDLTRPAGERVVNLSWRGRPLEAEQRLRVAVNSYRLNGGGGFEEIVRAPRLLERGPEVREALAAHVRRAGTLDGATAHGWTTLPDYASCVERPLVDLLVRRGAVPREEALRLFPWQPARRADLAYWLARAFGWSERRLSGAFADVPDPLEPWLDGLLRRGVLGREGGQDDFRPFAVASLETAGDWCVAAARSAGYALDGAAAAASFRRSLLAGTGLAGPGGSPAARRDTLSIAQAMGLVANARFPTVRVLHTTDFHGALLPGARERGSGRAVGGSAVLAAWIARLRAENPEGTILLDGGDAFQGTMISNLAFGRPVVEQMNLLGYGGFAVGNHDLDWSADTLERRVDEMRFAALGANLLERRTGRMPRWVRGDTVLTRRGVRVGLLGLAYTGTPRVTLASHVAPLRFDDDSATAARLVPALRRRARPHVVIGLGHTPGGLDSAGRVTGDLGRLARVPGVDLWTGGHSHNRLLAEEGGATVMISGAQGQIVGLCDLTVDPLAGRVVERRARLVPTYADEVTPDSAMLARVAGWNARVALLAATVIGRNARTLTRSRDGESPLGDLVADAMRAESGADLAFTNSGGLRADLAEGTITRGAVYDVIPFDNTLVLVRLTGRQVRELLEDGLAHGRISQQSGLRYRFDLSRPRDGRLLAVTLADGSPLDEARTYTVAVNNFMASGGDNYDTLARAGGQTDTGTLVREALERHLAALTRDGPLDVRVDGRIENAGRP